MGLQLEHLWATMACKMPRVVEIQEKSRPLPSTAGSGFEAWLPPRGRDPHHSYTQHKGQEQLDQPDLSACFTFISYSLGNGDKAHIGLQVKNSN